MPLALSLPSLSLPSLSLSLSLSLSDSHSLVERAPTPASIALYIDPSHTLSYTHSLTHTHTHTHTHAFPFLFSYTQSLIEDMLNVSHDAYALGQDSGTNHTRAHTRTSPPTAATEHATAATEHATVRAHPRSPAPPSCAQTPVFFDG